MSGDMVHSFEMKIEQLNEEIGRLHAELDDRDAVNEELKDDIRRLNEEAEVTEDEKMQAY